MDQFITCQTPSWNQQCLCLLQKFTIFWRKTNTISILTSEFQFRNTKPTQLELLSSSSFINQGRSSGLKVHIVKTSSSSYFWNLVSGWGGVWIVRPQIVSVWRGQITAENGVRGLQFAQFHVNRFISLLFFTMSSSSQTSFGCPPHSNYHLHINPNSHLLFSHCVWGPLACMLRSDMCTPESKKK